jgi:predicted Zn-dependent protease
MVKAGYDPRGMVNMFRTLAELSGDQERNSFEQLAASHPETQERIENAQARIAEMEPLSENLRVGRDKYEQMLQRLPAAGQ